MDNLARYYETLGLSPTASPDELRQAYRDLVKIWHPDRFAHDERLRLKAQEKLKEINGAYEVLRAAMFAAGADPGPQASPEPEPEPEQDSPPDFAQPPRHFTATATAVVGALGLIILLLTALCIILWTTDWLRGGKAIGSSPQTDTKHAGNASEEPGNKASARPPAVIADHIYTAADDFIVDIFHNGELVPDIKRSMIGETFGATVEKIALTIREGDWLVFNVVNNRLRWGGVYYFAAAGIRGDNAIAFESELGSGNWSFCDDPRSVGRFIAEAGFLAENKALSVERPWSRGDELMKQFVKGWDGQPVWGTNRNTWIKFRVPRAEGKAP